MVTHFQNFKKYNLIYILAPPLSPLRPQAPKPSHPQSLLSLSSLPKLLCLPNLQILHSALIRNLIKLKGTAKHDEQICLKDSKYILFEILENWTWKGCTNSCWPSQPNQAFVLAQPAGACMALPSPIF